VPLNIPPLRERKEDIPFLAEHFVRKLAVETGSTADSISETAIKRLLEYPWPGNVRELENVIERSLVLTAGKRLEATDIRLEANPRARESTTNSFLPDGVTLDEHEQAIIREALRRADGNKSQAARLLGLTRRTLYSRRERYGLATGGAEAEEAGEA
jgi:DNA-binding NtrC family response regulator